MSSYELPQVRVFQDLEATITPVQRAMLPVIIGELKDLIRYNEESERELGALGEYQREAVTWEYPTLGGNSTVIESTVRVWAENLYAAINKAPFVNDVLAVSPLTPRFDPDKYFTPVGDGQLNTVIFVDEGSGGVNLDGNAFHRAPVVGDYIRVRQESQDTVGQYEDWTAQVIDTVYTLASRNNEGVGTPKGDKANALEAAPTGPGLETSNFSRGDILEASGNLEYKVVSLLTIADTGDDRFVDKAESVYDSACAGGLFHLGDLGYSFRVTNVDDDASDFSYSITSRNGVTTGKMNFNRFIRELDTNDIYVWYDADAEELVGSGAGDDLGGIVVDDMFVIYATSAGSAGNVVKNDIFELTGSVGKPGIDYNGSNEAKPEVVDGSQFDSDTDTIYTVEVVRGGAKLLTGGVEDFFPSIQFRTSSNNNLDPSTVTNAVITEDGSIELPVGTKGIALKFNPTDQTFGTGESLATHPLIALARGDRWTVECTGLSGDKLVGVITDKNFPHYRVSLDVPYNFIDRKDGVTTINAPGFFATYEVDSTMLVNIEGCTPTSFNGEYEVTVMNDDQATFSQVDDDDALEGSYMSDGELQVGEWVELDGPYSAPGGSGSPEHIRISTGTVGIPALSRLVLFSGFDYEELNGLHHTEVDIETDILTVYGVSGAQVPPLGTGGSIKYLSIANAQEYAVIKRIDNIATLTSTGIASELSAGGTLGIILSGCTPDSFDGTYEVTVVDDNTVTFSNPGPGMYEGTHVSDGNVEIIDGQRLSIELLEKIDSVNIPKEQMDTAPNWYITENNTGISMANAIQVYDKDLGAELYVSSADMYAEYTALNETYTGTVLTVQDLSDDRIGQDDPDNPVGYGVRKALLNSAGVPVLAVCVSDFGDDLDDALNGLSTNNNAYQMVPMTYDMTAQDKITAHCEAMSTELMDRWRVNYICTDVSVEYPVADEDGEGNDITAYITQDTTSGLYNKFVLDDDVVDISLTDLNVKAGHTLRYGYTTDMYGATVYSEASIIRVLSATELLVLSDFGGDQSSQKITIFKDTGADDVIEKVGQRSAGINYRRVTNVYPPILEDTEGNTVEGYYAAAALAGLAGGVEPHQGLTNSVLRGFNSANLSPASRLGFTKLNELAGEGVTIIEGDNANIGVRHEMTTATIDRKNRETMITRNLDSLSYQHFDALSPFIGIANTTPEFVEKLRVELKALHGYIISTTKRPLIGSQMTSCTIDSVARDDVLFDKINIYLTPELPYPFNYGDVHIQI